MLSLMLGACGGGNEATIKGTFSGLDQNTVYLDLIATSDITPVDSAKTDEKGRFKFRVALSDKLPAFYNLRYNGQTITLLLAPGETVRVKSLGNYARNYVVEGSEDSRRIKELNSIMLTARTSLDSISDLYGSPAAGDAERRSLLGQYSKIYLKQKQDMIKFIVNNATSLAAVYALYQRTPNGENVFGTVNDLPYFRLVSDSLSSRYPGSPHVLSLKQDVKTLENRLELNNMLSNAEASGISYPDLDLPDMFGKKVKLSSIRDKVVLLDFWSAAAPESRLLNAELMQLYRKYAGQGFEVYQVALDESKPLWITAVQEQKLLWISVCDFQGANSPAVRLYNVTSLPANFLIDREGRIVARNLTESQLDARLDELL